MIKVYIGKRLVGKFRNIRNLARKFVPASPLDNYQYVDTRTGNLIMWQVIKNAIKEYGKEKQNEN